MPIRVQIANYISPIVNRAYALNVIVKFIPVSVASMKWIIKHMISIRISMDAHHVKMMNMCAEHVVVPLISTLPNIMDSMNVPVAKIELWGMIKSLFI